jgi:hypothetical protein
MNIDPNRDFLLPNSERNTQESKNLKILQQNVLFRKDIHLIITESLARKQTPFFNLILKLIDYVKEKMGYKTTLSKRLEEKISTFLPKNLKTNSELIESIRKQIIQSPQNFKRTLPLDQIHAVRYDLNPKEQDDLISESIPESKEQDSELAFVLSRIFKKSSFASIILKGNWSNLNKSIAKNLPASRNQNQDLINRIESYITQNQASLLDVVIDAQLDRLLSKSRCRNALLQIISKNFDSTQIINFLTHSVDRSLLSNDEFKKKFCSYIMENKQSIKDFIENINQRYSESTIDFHANKLLKKTNFQNFFLESLDANTQTFFSQLKQQITIALNEQESDESLVDMLEQYMRKNKERLKIKAQEFKFLEIIEKRFSLQDMKCVKEILENKREEQWVQKITPFFKVQENLTEPLKTFLEQDKEGIVLLLGVLIKINEQRQLRT